MPSSYCRQPRIYFAVFALALMVAIAASSAESPKPAGSVVQGRVRDSVGRLLPNATVTLELSSRTQTLGTSPQITHTDSAGAYRFAVLQYGAYMLRAEMNGYVPATLGPVSLAPKETKQIDLSLAPLKAAPGKAAAAAPEFFDEPQFTVAGVTQATNSGGHGSDTVLRTTEALAKATVSLSNNNQPDGASNAAASPAIESSLRESIARNSADPALHHQLGDVEEKLGVPLAAVREYQRAAELDPSEPNLFDWGTELLKHRALEPATEVFTRGNRLFPKSVRMLVALGVAWSARGSYDRAEQCVEDASDLAPYNPTPYVFLGRMQSVVTLSNGAAERLARFARLQPDSALANYYYAVSLWKQSAGGAHDAHDHERNSEPSSERNAGLSAQVESLLL